MELKLKLKSQMKEALKAKDKIALEVIRSLLSAIQYEEIKAKIEDLPDDQVIGVLKAEQKKLHETKEYAEKDGRVGTVSEVNAQLSVLQTFLPSQLGRDELEKIISDFAKSDPNANVGSIMKHLKDNFSGQYDGKLASELTRQVLAG